VKLDHNLSQLVDNAARYANQVKQSAIDGDDEGQRKYWKHLQASMLIFGIYRNEVAERGIESMMFPKTNQAVKRTLNLIAAAKQSMLLEMEREQEALEHGRA
jgi:hypothetical protein